VRAALPRGDPFALTAIAKDDHDTVHIPARTLGVRRSVDDCNYEL
jgi:hypothetical protein